MDLYICWGTFPSPRPGGHPCANAYHALRDAGYEPNLIKGYGLGILPDAIFNNTHGRREAKRLTGSSMLPVLVTDDGEVVSDSRRIVQWAKAHPAPAAA
jgi:hypothetical protein